MATPTTASPTWLRRNRLWLILLPALLLLAMAASSFRLTALYLPWSWSHPIVAHGPTGTLSEEFMAIDGSTHRRDVTVTVHAVQPVSRLGDDAAAAGGQLWRLDLTFAAPPDQIVDLCSVLLVDAVGNRYDSERAGKVAAPDATWWWSERVACVPEDAPGPKDSILGIEESPVPRPESWPVTAGVVLPAGVEPVGVVVRWHEPTYLQLDVPA